jgi:putative transposase
VTDLQAEVSRLKRALDVSRSGFYEWQRRSTKPDPDTTALEIAARAAHARGRECYEPKRLRAELAEMGFVRSLATVKRLRSRLGLRCRHKRCFVRTTDGNHTLPIAPDLLERKFDQTDAPN